MIANKPTKNASSLTSLRLEKTKLLSELDKITDCKRETRKTKNPIIVDKKERIKQIQKRIKEIDTTLKENTTRTGGILKTFRMMHSPKKNEKKIEENEFLGGINMLPAPIQTAVAQKIHDDNNIPTSVHTGAIKKGLSINTNDENEERKKLIDMKRRSLNFDVNDWDFSDNEASNNQKNLLGTIRNSIQTQDDRKQHELEEIRRARLELKREHEKLCEMKMNMSLPTHNTIPHTTFAPIYTRPTQQTVTSSIPMSYYQTPHFAPNHITTPYVQHYQTPNMNQFISYPQTNIPITIPNTYGIQNTTPFIHATPTAPTPAMENQNRFPYNPSNASGNECRKTFLKHLDSVPQFAGESREKLMNFIETCDILDKFKINDAENGELLMKITLQLKGEPRASINQNNMIWTSIRENLLKQFHYLSNRDILNSKIENLKQERNESLIQYTERTRRLLTEKNKSYDNITADQKTEHDRITRKAFVHSIYTHKLREIMRLRGATSLEESISLAIELQNEIRSIIPNRELFCTFCNSNGHRESTCEKRGRQNPSINQLMNAMQQLNTSNRYNNNNTSSTSQQRYNGQSIPNIHRYNNKNSNYPQYNNNNFNAGYQTRYNGGYNNNNNYNQEAVNRNTNGNTNNGYPGGGQNNNQNNNYNNSYNNNRKNINNIEYEELPQVDYDDFPQSEN